MAWVRIDDGFFSHPKATMAGKDGRELFLAATCYSNKQLTNGLVPISAMPIIAAQAGVTAWKKVAEELVKIGLFDRSGDGYAVHDFLEYNPTKEDVINKREAAQDRMRKTRKSASSEDVRANITRTNDEVQIPPTPTQSPRDYNSNPTPNSSGEAAVSDLRELAPTLTHEALLIRFRKEFPQWEPRLAKAVQSSSRRGSEASYLRPLILRILDGEEPEPFATPPPTPSMSPPALNQSSASYRRFVANRAAAEQAAERDIAAGVTVQ